MEFTALIVDDEADSRSVLRKLLKTFCPQVKVVGEAPSSAKAYEMVLELKPEAVFLDIQMPGGNGFSLLKKFSKIPFETIFVTSYDKYAIEAIKLSALHYLMKPVEVDDLIDAVQRLENNLMKKESRQEQLINVIFNMDGGVLEKRIAVHFNDRVKLLLLSDITHLEGERNYTTIHTIQNEKYNTAKNLGEFEEMLTENAQFFRIGKGCIVNLNHIKGYTKGEPCVITLAGDLNFEISRRKKQDFLDRFKK
jgi:two-component system LytT family response regulator